MADFQADFFNNVAAVCVVLLFTKLVTHRSGSKRTSDASHARTWWWLHLVSTLSAAAGTAVALAAVQSHDDSRGIHAAAWALMGLSATILLVDVLFEDLPD